VVIVTATARVLVATVLCVVTVLSSNNSFSNSSVICLLGGIIGTYVETAVVV
jgi:hypothetical protein